MRTDDDAYTTLVDKFGYDANDGVPSSFAEWTFTTAASSSSRDAYTPPGPTNAFLRTGRVVIGT